MIEILPVFSNLFRFKDGKGDPLGFKIFLKSKKIDRSLIPRYIGNRLHVIFHLGGSIYFLKDHLLTYLKTQCNQQKLRLALIGMYNLWQKAKLYLIYLVEKEILRFNILVFRKITCSNILIPGT